MKYKLTKLQIEEIMEWCFDNNTLELESLKIRLARTDGGWVNVIKLEQFLRGYVRREYRRVYGYNAPDIRNGEVVTPLGTFSEAVREKTYKNIDILIIYICFLMIAISLGVGFIILS